MDMELSRHASHYSYYSAMQDLCKKKLDDKNLELTMYMARTRKERPEDARHDGTFCEDGQNERRPRQNVQYGQSKRGN